MQHRPLSLATDGDDNVWFVTEDGGSARYDGTRFSRVQLDATGDAWPLMFWSRGTTAAAVARVGPNQVRTYRFAGGHWQPITERPIDTAGPGIVDVKFLSVDERGRYWLGIRVIETNTTPRVGRGRDRRSPCRLSHSSIRTLHRPVACKARSLRPMISRQSNSTQPGPLGSRGSRERRALRCRPSPEGHATVHTYNETTGLQGDVVSDLARGPGDKLFVATPEALGRIEGSQFVFDVDGSSAMPRVIALATDNSSALWGAGPRGAWVYNGHNFRPVGRGDGLTNEQFNDIAVDGLNRVWFVTSDGISIMAQHITSASAGVSGTPEAH